MNDSNNDNTRRKSPRKRRDKDGVRHATNDAKHAMEAVAAVAKLPGIKNSKRAAAGATRYQKPRDTVGFRPPAELREFLIASAKEAGHSLSDEVVQRVQNSIGQQDWARRSLLAAFGDYETMAIAFGIARAAKVVSNRRRAHWLGDEEAFAEVSKAIDRIMEAIAPLGQRQWAPSSEAHEAWSEYTQTEEYRQAGRSAAIELLSIVENSADSDEVWWPFGDPAATNTREFQRDLIDRKELLRAWRELLVRNKGGADKSG